MKKYLRIFCLLGFLVHISVAHSAWFIVDIDNNTDLTLLRAVRDNDIEIPSISVLFTQSLHPYKITLPIEAAFGSLGGCKIVAQNKEGQLFTFAFFGDPAYRVANGRALFADLESRNAAASLLSSMMARVFMIRSDGSMQLVGFTSYEVNNQLVALKLSGSDGNYQVALNLIK